MLGVLTGFAIIGSIIAVGYLIGRMRLLGDQGQYVLNRCAFFVASPALLFTVLAQSQVADLFSGILLNGAVAFVAVVLMYLLISRLVLRRGSWGESLVGGWASGYSNLNNIGLPVATYVIGDVKYVAPLFLMQLIVLAPALLTGLDMLSRGKASIGVIIAQPLKNPILIGSVLGLIVALTGLRVPAVVLRPVELIGGAAIPMMLLAFGISLTGQRVLTPGSRREVLIAATLKAVVMPLIAGLLAHFVWGFDNHLTYVCTVLAALPTAQNIYTFSSRYNIGTVIARDVVLLTTFASLPVILVVALLLRT